MDSKQHIDRAADLLEQAATSLDNGGEIRAGLLSAIAQGHAMVAQAISARWTSGEMKGRG